MRILTIAFAIVTFLILSACASAPSLQSVVPVKAQGAGYALAKSERVTTTSHMTQHLDADGTVVYLQNQGGGGAALGVLLGPIGVAANIAAIEGVTKADVQKIKGKLNLQPEAAFLQAASGVNFPLQRSAASADAKVTPFVLVSKNSDESIRISPSLLFEGSDGTNKWIRRYQYELSGMYTLDEISRFDEGKSQELQRACVNAFSLLLDHVQRENPAGIAAEAPITLKSPYLSPRFEFEMRGSLIGTTEGRTWVRTVGGVYAVLPSDIQLKAASPK